MDLPRPWSAVLTVSLAANLFVVGFIVSDAMTATPDPDAARISTQRTWVSPPVAQQVFDAHLGTIQEAVDTMHAAEARVAEVLAAPEFSQDDFVEALQELRMWSLRSQRRTHDAMIEAVVLMTPVERQALAEASRTIPAATPK